MIEKIKENLKSYEMEHVFKKEYFPKDIKIFIGGKEIKTDQDDVISMEKIAKENLILSFANNYPDNVKPSLVKLVNALEPNFKVRQETVDDLQILTFCKTLGDGETGFDDKDDFLREIVEKAGKDLYNYIIFKRGKDLLTIEKRLSDIPDVLKLVKLKKEITMKDVLHSVNYSNHLIFLDLLHHYNKTIKSTEKTHLEILDIYTLQDILNENFKKQVNVLGAEQEIEKLFNLLVKENQKIITRQVFVQNKRFLKIARTFETIYRRLDNILKNLDVYDDCLKRKIRTLSDSYYFLAKDISKNAVYDSEEAVFLMAVEQATKHLRKHLKIQRT